MRFGIILVIVGLLAFLNNAGLLSAYTMSIVWPITLIVVGTWIILRRRCCWKKSWGRNCDCHDDCDHKNGVCAVDEKKS